MGDTNVNLIKGSGTVLRYADKDPTTGVYTPQASPAGAYYPCP